MGLKMEITCGTRSPRQFEIDLDEYGFRKPDLKMIGVTPEEHKRAFDLLRTTMNDTTFADDHFRNDDAVNGCIALHVLGYDAEDWFAAFCEEQKNNAEQWFASDLIKFMEHVDRICGCGYEYDTNYLLRWGPEGDRGAALGYAID